MKKNSAKTTFYITPTSKQRIALLAALQSWVAAGSPMPAEFKRTHVPSARDVQALIDQISRAPMTPVVILLDGAFQGEAFASDRDVPVRILATADRSRALDPTPIPLRTGRRLINKACGLLAKK